MSNQTQENGYTVVGALIGALIVMIISISVWWAIYRSTNHHQVTFTLQKSERVVDSSGKSAKYLLYTDKAVYEDTDSILNGKFNSSDLYARLENGKSYSCDVVGFRNGFFSMYENIISCKESTS